ncbi:hypothetical protein IFR05_000169 [Cadophora sp. M221]|nr:hypothetical protein IFR05_000169 [Cadophora sp. M221]
MANPAFKLFSKLPAELQLNIWEAVDIPASLITVKASQELLSDNFELKSQPSFIFKYRLPAMFQICQSSRKTALRSHPLRFAGGLFGPFFATPFPFNAEKDILFFAEMEIAFALAINYFQDFNVVRQIAVEPEYLDDCGMIIHTMVSLFRMGAQLEKIHIVPENDLGSALAEWADLDGNLDYERIGNIILPSYIMRVAVMGFKKEISQEQKHKLMWKKFYMISPTDFAAKFEYPGLLRGEHRFECPCTKFPVEP